MKIKVKGKTESERFNNVMRGLLAVPHSEIKAKLDDEKRAKKRKKAKASASGHALIGSH
jgi:hypothetical protein